MYNKNKVRLSIGYKPIKPLTKEECIKHAGLFSTLKYLNEFNGSIKELEHKINEGYVIIPALFKKNVVNPKGNYTRKKENFYCIETLFLDIDNSESIRFTDEDGKKHTVTVDYLIDNEKHVSIDYAKEVMKNLGLDYFIIYKTLSWKEDQHKFRIGFKLPNVIYDGNEADQVYQNLCATLQPLGVTVDSKALECSRLFYPGKVIEIKENSILDINKLVQWVDDKKQNKSKQSTNKSKKVKDSSKQVERLYTVNTVTKEYFVNYINNKVQEILEVDFSSRYEILNNIINLKELLNVKEQEKFCCLFHLDKNPSAYIYLNEQGHYSYHCFGCEIRLNGVQFIKTLFGFDETDFINFLEDNTQIRIGSTYQKQALQILAHNLNYIYNPKGLESDNQTVYKYLKRRNLLSMFKIMYTLGNLYLTYFSLSRYETDITFFASVEFIKNFYNDEYKTKLTYDNVRRKINTLVNLGLIDKISLHDLNEQAKQRCLGWLDSFERRMKYTNFYRLNKLTLELLTRAENIILLEKELGVKQKNAGKKQASVVHTIEKAEQIYIQNSTKIEISKEKLYRETVAYIHTLGKGNSFEVKDVLKNIDLKRKKRKAYKTRQVEIYLPLLIKNGLIKKVRCSKSNKEIYNIPLDYPPQKSVYICLCSKC